MKEDNAYPKRNYISSEWDFPPCLPLSAGDGCQVMGTPTSCGEDEVDEQAGRGSTGRRGVDASVRNRVLTPDLSKSRLTR
jgi:hypothetical protein